MSTALLALAVSAVALLALIYHRLGLLLALRPPSTVGDVSKRVPRG